MDENKELMGLFAGSFLVLFFTALTKIINIPIPLWVLIAGSGGLLMSKIKDKELRFSFLVGFLSTLFIILLYNPPIKYIFLLWLFYFVLVLVLIFLIFPIFEKGEKQ